nr:hypothetical protein [Diadromus pulchellus ascovirus 4a]
MWDADLVKIGVRNDRAADNCSECAEQGPVDFAEFISQMVPGSDGSDRRKALLDTCLMVAKSGLMRVVLNNKGLKDFFLEQVCSGNFIFGNEAVSDVEAEIAGMF